MTDASQPPYCTSPWAKSPGQPDVTAGAEDRADGEIVVVGLPVPLPVPTAEVGRQPLQEGRQVGAPVPGDHRVNASGQPWRGRLDGVLHAVPVRPGRVAEPHADGVVVPAADGHDGRRVEVGVVGAHRLNGRSRKSHPSRRLRLGEASYIDMVGEVDHDAFGVHAEGCGDEPGIGWCRRPRTAGTRGPQGAGDEQVAAVDPTRHTLGTVPAGGYAGDVSWLRVCATRAWAAVGWAGSKALRPVRSSSRSRRSGTAARTRVPSAALAQR